MKKIFLIAVAAIAALVSCTHAERIESVMGDDLQVRFTTSVGTYTVKSNDTGFDNGDAIGITALNPINASNVKYIYRDGALVPEGEGIKWVQAQKTPTLFYAVYPYREDFHMNNDGTFGDFEEIPNALLITVESDQSTYEGYSRSNQLACSVTAAPGEEVNMSFYHNVTKVVISVDNRIGANITEAYLANVYGRYLRYDGSNAGNLGAIKAYREDESTWKLLVVPQSSRPTIVLKTAEGKEYCFEYPEGGNIRFYNGDQIKFSVLLDDSATSSTFTSEVENWSEDTEIEFDNEAYTRRKALAGLFGEYTATSSSKATNNPWTMKLQSAGTRVAFYNLFANPAWAADDTLYYGDISEDMSTIIIPCGQAAEYVYNGTPLVLWRTFIYTDENETTSWDAEDEGSIVVEIVRNDAGDVIGLDFGDYGTLAYINGAGYIGMALPKITATKITE
jgi:hypothetical protein